MYSRTKNWITICRINGIHPFVIAVNFVFYALILLFLPLENRKYAKFRKLVTVYYPQIRIDRPKLFDPLRIVVQTLYILLFVFERSDGPLPFVRHAKYLINLFTALFFRPAQILTARIVNTYGRLVKEKQPAVRTDSNAGGPVFESITVNLILMLLSLGLTLLFVTQPLSLTYQFIFMGIIWLIAVLINSVRNRISLIIMIFMSIMIASRYIWWRCTSTVVFYDWMSALFSLSLFAAEFYSFIVMILSYIQISWVLDRKPYPLPQDCTIWPTVDIFIPTYNEPLDVVKPCILAAADLDWPKDKLKVHILDDGSREEFEKYAKHIGVNYIKREKHDHAKAGNINHALTVTDGELIAIFDCDHIPTRAFLQMTVGWMVHDQNIALVQTPHHFYSDDPFEKNLGIKGKVPAENSLFHDFIQKGNDMWNATMFCGSCAVIRRKPLEEIGGIAQETVTEDAHTSLRLNARGYSSAFISIPLAAGLSTESLGDHINQRIRWARGMVQIFRVDNPIFKKGLTLAQRICFSNAMIHFLHGLPRIIFLLAPLPYLFFNIYVIFASGLAILAYVLPYMVISTMTNSRIQGKRRFFFWGAIYETILSWYITIPTTVALISPKHGKFNVTAKGASNSSTYFDWNVSRVYIGLILLNLAGFFTGICHMFTDTSETVTILVNLGWVLYNLLILGAAAAVALEKKQVRSSPRVYTKLPAVLELNNGEKIDVKITDFSQAGLGVALPDIPEHFSWSDFIDVRHPLYINLFQAGTTYRFRCSVQRLQDCNLGLEMLLNTRQDNMEFIRCTFATADRWLYDENISQKDTLFRGIHMLFTLGFNGYIKILQNSPWGIRHIFEFIVRTFMFILSLFPVPSDSSKMQKILDRIRLGDLKKAGYGHR